MTLSSRRRPRLLQRPDEGWSSLLLLLGMLVILGLSIADARPLVLAQDGGSSTGGFVVLLVSAGLIGFVLARSSLGVVQAHLVGAVVAALLLLFVAGAALEGGEGPALPLSLEAVNARVGAVWERLDHDVAAYVSEVTHTPIMATYLVLGAICWTTAQFGAFSVFRYGRGGPAVMATGAVLFLNIALGSLQIGADPLPVLPVLAVFAALSMLLLMRLQLVQQRQQWARRHIADANEVGRLFLRSGVLFVAVSVVGATSLTAWASVDAQDVDLGDLEKPIEEVGTELSRWLGLVGVPPPEATATTIGDSWEVRSLWEQPGGVAFRARVDGALRGNYWWGWEHDRFDGQTWSRDKVRSTVVEAGEPLPIRAEASNGGPHPVSATITVGRAPLVRGMLFRPAETTVVDRAVTIQAIDDGGGLGDITYEDELRRNDTTLVDAWVRDYRADGDSLTANQLRVAGDDYPAWTERYLQGAADTAISGALVLDMAEAVMAAQDNAYDRAIEAQDRLQRMDYTTDMRGVCRDGEPVPQCVLRAEQGFCQHYSTTMTMVLRAMDIPSRVITGYLPGARREGEWVVEQAAFHNWVEAYFPGHGWVRFDPTPASRGFGQAATAFPDGEVVLPDGDDSLLPTPSADEVEPLATPDPLDDAVVPLDRSDDGGATGGLLLAVGGTVVMLVLVVAALLFVRLRRLPGGDGGLAYGGIVDLATRIGHGPHPSQTEYEYASSLSEVIPQLRDEVYLVTEARVETAYGQREVGAERQGSLRRAYARIRTALLRLTLHLRR